MFKRLLSGAGGFFRSDREWNMAGELNSLFLCFVGDRERFFPRQEGETFTKSAPFCFAWITACRASASLLTLTEPGQNGLGPSTIALAMTR